MEDEFAVIDKYFKPLCHKAAGLCLGPGDDCALLAPPAGMEVCITTDAVVGGRHIPAGAGGALAAGRSLGGSLSDLAAMGASPYALLLSLTLPGIAHGWLADFSAALKQGLAAYALPLIGGNLAKGELAITMTALGLVPQGQAIRRGGASPGQGLYVTGSIGDAYYGLQMCLAGETGASPLLARYERPCPRLATGQALRGLATAMIDVSDGLLADAGHLLAASGVQGTLDLDWVPLSPALRQAGVADPAQVVNHGDDYELCFTAPPGREAELQAVAAATQVPITRIGKTAKGKGLVVTQGGKPVAGLPQGHNHFRES